MSTGELIERFAIERVGRAAAIFDEQKLRWMNGRFMRELDLGEYEARLGAHLERSDPEAARAFEAASPERRRMACAIVQEKAQTLAEVWALIGFLFAEPEREEKAWDKVMIPEAEPLLRAARDALAAVEPFDAAAIEPPLAAIVADAGVKAKALYQPIRVALTGTTVSPGIFESLAALGRDASLERIDSALERLRA